MYHDRSRYYSDTEQPVWINLTPLGWLDFKYWLVTLVLVLLLVIGMACGLPAFATHPHGYFAQFYQQSLAWGTLGHNAPLSHFPLATVLSYVLAVCLGVLLAFMLLITRIELDLRRLVQIWRTDFTVLFAAISLAGMALMASIFVTLPFTDIHLLSLQTHTDGVVQTLLMYSLQSRWGLVAVSIALFFFTLLMTVISVLAPCLSAKAAQHDLLVDA